MWTLTVSIPLLASQKGEKTLVSSIARPCIHNLFSAQEMS